MTLSYAADALSSRVVCTNISIVEDEIVEDDEMFSVLINSSDPSVMIERNSAAVLIIDNNSKCMVPVHAGLVPSIHSTAIQSNFCM